MSVSPLTIHMMLGCAVSTDPKSYVGEEVWRSSAGINTLQWLLENKLVNGDETATEKGKAWVEFICETPIPVQVWVKP